MKILILRDTVVGGQAVKAGQVVEAADADARYLLAVRKAETLTERPEPEPVEAPKRKPRPKVNPDGNQSGIT